jgi:hypothetical protein
MDYLKDKEKDVEVIKKLIQSGKPFSVTRIGLSEVGWIDRFIRSGINSNSDILSLNTEIISKEYLDGCFQLGQQYPDLCSSIFMVCKKNKYFNNVEHRR